MIALVELYAGVQRTPTLDESDHNCRGHGISEDSRVEVSFHFKTYTAAFRLVEMRLLHVR